MVGDKRDATSVEKDVKGKQYARVRLLRPHAATAVIVVSMLAACSGKRENAGLWSGTCPAPESDVQRDLAKCWSENKPGVSCGRTVVSARTGNNDNYELGDKLDECWICAKYVKAGVYAKGTNSCVETHWMNSPEAERIDQMVR